LSSVWIIERLLFADLRWSSTVFQLVAHCPTVIHSSVVSHSTEGANIIFDIDQ
jgi:hypothetical protein